MAELKFADIEGISKTELLNRRRSARERLFELKMKHSMGQVGNPLEIRKLRRELAKYLTALNRKFKDVKGNEINEN